MLVDLVKYRDGWYVTYTIGTKEVDRAGPFDEEWEAEDCARRA